MAARERETTANALLGWLRSAGARVGKVALRSDECGGVGVFATERVAGGAELLACPCDIILCPAVALADPTIGAALRAHVHESRWQLILMLLHCKQPGVRGPWSAYVASLPSADELLPSLPLHWEPAQLEQLRGSSLARKAEESLMELRRFHDEVLARLRAEFPAEFPAAAFGWPQLCWAHAIFWSRAITLPLPGGAQECLVCGVSPNVGVKNCGPP